LKTLKDHAEVGAMWFFEYQGRFAGQNGIFSEGSFIAAYGVYGPNCSQPGLRGPCGEGTSSNVPCWTTLSKLRSPRMLSNEDEC